MRLSVFFFLRCNYVINTVSAFRRFLVLPFKFNGARHVGV